MEDDDATLLRLRLLRVDHGSAHNEVDSRIFAQFTGHQAQSELAGQKLVGMKHWDKKKNIIYFSPTMSPWQGLDFKDKNRQPSKVCWSTTSRLCTSTSSPKEVSWGEVLLGKSLLELTLLDRAWG